MIAIRWTYTETNGNFKEQVYDSMIVETQGDLEDALQIINDEIEGRNACEDCEVKLDSIQYFQCVPVDNPKEFLKDEGGIQ